MIRFFLIITAGFFCISPMAYAGEESNDELDENEAANNESEYKLTGDTRRCIRNVDIEWYNIVDRNTLLFRTTDGYFFNNLKGKCYLPLSDNVSITFHTRRGFTYCKNDGLTASVPGRTRGFTRCALDIFEEAIEVNDSTE